MMETAWESGKGKLAMEHSERPPLVVAQVVIAHLQQSVRALMDEDRVLPTDGSSLLAALDRELAGPNGESAAAARAGIEAFIAQVEALVDAGVLEAADGHPPIEMAVALGALLHGAEEKGSTAATRRTDAGVG
jgi:hypothetical protein